MMSDEREKPKRKSMRARGSGGIFRYAGSKYWWVSYLSGGKRHFESSRSTRRGDAQDLLTKRLGKIAEGVAVTPQMFRATIAEGLQAVVDDLTNNGCESVEHTKSRIQNHLLKHPATDDEPAGGFFDPNQKMSEVTGVDIERYKSARLEQKAKPATINRELAIMKKAFRLVMRNGMLLAMPSIAMLAENNIRTGFFEPEQFEAVAAQLPTHVQPLVRFLYLTGWRKDEGRTLTVGQVDLKARVVRLNPGETKSGEGRTVSLTTALYALLKTQLDSIEKLAKAGTISPWIFHESNGDAITGHRLRVAWDLATDKAGYPDRLLHDLRRTAVRRLERAGVPRSTAMQMVGHKTESIYRRYAIQDEAMLREAAAKLDAYEEERAQGPQTGSKPRGQLKRFRNRER